MATKLTEMTHDVVILCECTPDYHPERRIDWCGLTRDDAYRVMCEVTNVEITAARALASGKTGRMIRALIAMDNDAQRSVSTYSNLAAVSADQEDYAVAYRQLGLTGDAAREYARERHARRERDALDTMLAPMSRHAALRRRLVSAIRAVGFDLVGGTDPDYPPLHCARHLARDGR